jgi:hypothetical protein
MAPDRLVGIGGTGRQVSALSADQARKRELIEPDQRMGGATGRQNQRAHDAGAVSRAAICDSASTTASKVNKVEA